MTSFSLLKFPKFCVLKKKYAYFFIICFFVLDDHKSESASLVTAVVNRPYIKAPDERWNYFWLMEKWIGKLKYSARNLPYCQPVHHNLLLQMWLDCLRTDTESLTDGVGNKSPWLRHCRRSSSCTSARENKEIYILQFHLTKKGKSK